MRSWSTSRRSSRTPLRVADRSAWKGDRGGGGTGPRPSAALRRSSTCSPRGNGGRDGRQRRGASRQDRPPLKASCVDFAGTGISISPAGPTSACAVHAEGEWLNGSDQSGTFGRSIGPEVGTLRRCRSRRVIRHANRCRATTKWYSRASGSTPQRRMRSRTPTTRSCVCTCADHPDAAMDDLAKTQPGSPIFSFFSASARSRPKSARRLRIRGRVRRHGCLRSGEQRHSHPTDANASQACSWTRLRRSPRSASVRRSFPKEQVGTAGARARRQRVDRVGRVRRPQRIPVFLSAPGPTMPRASLGASPSR